MLWVAVSRGQSTPQTLCIPNMTFPNNCSSWAAQLPAVKSCSNAELLHQVCMVSKFPSFHLAPNHLGFINLFRFTHILHLKSYCRQFSIPPKHKSNQEALHFLSAALAHLIPLPLSFSLLTFVWLPYSFQTIAGESLNCDLRSIVV